MSSSAEEIVTATCVVAAANTLHGDPDERAAYPYQRIVGISVGDVSLSPGKIAPGVSERELTLTTGMADRLMQCADLLQGPHYYNCHRFSRVMIGIIEPLWDYERRGPDPEQHCSPPSGVIDTLPRKSSLPLGAWGVVELTPSTRSGIDFKEGTVHSVVGLGEDVPESLQVSCWNGILGIVRNKDLLRYYRGYVGRGAGVELRQVSGDRL